MSSYDVELKEGYDTLVSLLSSRNYDYVELEQHSDIRLKLMDLHNYIHSSLGAKNTHKGYPDGHWYMCTVTSRVGEERASVMANHDKVLAYLGTDKIYYAVLERSSIWHIHYIVCLSDYHKNQTRDLQKLLGVRVRFENHVNTLKKWNGLCKYVMKRDYAEEKASTHEETLISRITYTEGEGYKILKTPVTVRIKK